MTAVFNGFHQLQAEARKNASNYALTASFHILPNLFFTVF